MNWDTDKLIEQLKHSVKINHNIPDGMTISVPRPRLDDITIENDKIIVKGSIDMSKVVVVENITTESDGEGF